MKVRLRAAVLSASHSRLQTGSVSKVEVYWPYVSGGSLLVQDLAGARQQYDDVFHVTKMANRFMLIREPNDSPHADARRDLESQGEPCCSDVAAASHPSSTCTVITGHLRMCRLWNILSSLSLGHTCSSVYLCRLRKSLSGGRSNANDLQS